MNIHTVNFGVNMTLMYSRKAEVTVPVADSAAGTKAAVHSVATAKLISAVYTTFMLIIVLKGSTTHNKPQTATLASSIPHIQVIAAAKKLKYMVVRV